MISSFFRAAGGSRAGELSEWIQRGRGQRVLCELEGSGFKSWTQAVVSHGMFGNVSLPCQTELVIAKCLLCAGTGYPEGFGNYSLVLPWAHSLVQS